MFDLSQAVRLVQPVVAGPVLDRRFNNEQSQMEYLVEFDGSDGQPAQRWFLESQLEQVPA